MPVRRRRGDPAVEAARGAFAAVATHVEAAQRALLSAVPTSRDAGVPLAQALASFARHLSAADDAMDALDREAFAHEWTKCDEALKAARAEAVRLRTEPGVLGFEALNARIGDVLLPLEVFADVERGLRRR